MPNEAAIKSYNESFLLNNADKFVYVYPKKSDFELSKVYNYKKLNFYNGFTSTDEATFGNINLNTTQFDDVVDSYICEDFMCYPLQLKQIDFTNN